MTVRSWSDTHLFFVLDRYRKGVTYSNIIQEFRQRWPEKDISSSQVRYVIRRYRDDAAYGPNSHIASYAIPFLDMMIPQPPSNPPIVSASQPSNPTFAVLPPSPPQTGSYQTPYWNAVNAPQRSTTMIPTGQGSYTVFAAPARPSLYGPDTSRSGAYSKGPDIASKPWPTLPKAPAPIPNDDNPSTFYDEAGPETVAIYVGPYHKRFSIHMKLLCEKSKFWNREFNTFTAAFARKQTYHESDDPVTFAFVFHWLYREKLPKFPRIEAGQADIAPENAPKLAELYNKIFTRLIDVYCLAQKLEIPELMNLVTGNLGKAYYESQMWPSQQDITEVYTRVNQSCGLRRYMASSFRYMLHASKDANPPKNLPPKDSIDDLGTALPALKVDSFNLSWRQESAAEPSLDFVCDYHDHDGLEDCEFKGKNFQGHVVGQ